MGAEKRIVRYVSLLEHLLEDTIVVAEVWKRKKIFLFGRNSRVMISKEPTLSRTVARFAIATDTTHLVD